MKLSRIQGQASWRFTSDKVDAAITQQGGHLAPIRFHLPHGVVEPYSVAPWAEEKESAKLPRLLQSLRGDFFCAPFGGSESSYRGEKHPPHGEVAHESWKLESIKTSKDETELHLSLKVKVRPGHVDKIIRLRRGETALYCRHVLTGMAGPMNFGHHATLKFPDAEGSGLIDTSPISFGQVLPVAFEKPAEGGYNSLKVGALFSKLNHVPAIDGTVADLSRYPARRGFEDLVMMAHQASSDFAWTAVTFPTQRYVWFALKDPRVLRSTVMWISNGGRHYAPWNGRHVNVMGLEDVTSYFHLGLAESAKPNPVSRRGIATHLTLKSSSPLTVNYIMAVAAIPKNWGRVKSIVPSPKGVTLKSDKGRAVHAPLDLNFLYSKS
jgi:hypothetical protein